MKEHKEETETIKDKKKAAKKLKKIIKRVCRAVICGAFLLCIGYFLGIHHRVIEALVKGEELPEAPKGHCLHK